MRLGEILYAKASLAIQHGTDRRTDVTTEVTLRRAQLISTGMGERLRAGIYHLGM